MRNAFALVLFLAAPAVAAQASEWVAVNLYADVRSDDGYLNLRSEPSSSETVLRRLPNGERVLVVGCERRTRGRRWCRVLRGSRIGFVYDAELRYRRAVRPARTTAAGTGVADGFVADEDPTMVTRRVRSDDGYVNLRSGPGTSHRVLQQLRNGERLNTIAYDTDAIGAGMWLLVRTDAGVIGYAYDRELEHEGP